MRDWRHYYWKLFNVLGRVVGIGFILVGIILCASGIGMLVTTTETTEAWVMIASSLIGVVFGVLTLFARPYKSDGPK